MDAKVYQTQAKQDISFVIHVIGKVMSILPRVARVNSQLLAWVKSASVLGQRRLVSSGNVLHESEDSGNSSVGDPDTEIRQRRRKFWTDDEKDTLRGAIKDGLPKLQILALLPGRTWKTISQRKYQLEGLEVERPRRRPSLASTKTISELAARGSTAEEIQIQFPDLSIASIRLRAKVHGASYKWRDARKGSLKRWTEAEDEIALSGIVNKLPTYVLLERLPGRTPTALESRQDQLRSVAKDNCPIRSPKGQWSTEEDQRVLTLYDSGKPIAEIGALIGRTVLSIRGRLGKLRKWYIKETANDSGNG